MISILNPEFKYTSSAATDIRKTFARIRREQKTQMPVAARAGQGITLPVDTSAPNKVTKIKAAR